MLCKVLAAVLLLFSGADAQLRPRRVGVSSMGEQEAPEGAAASFEQGMEAGLEALKAMGGGMGGDGGMAEMMKAMSGGMGGEGGMAGMSEMMKAMGGNEQMAGELQELLSNPEAMQAKMAEVFMEARGHVTPPSRQTRQPRRPCTHARRAALPASVEEQYRW